MREESVGGRNVGKAGSGPMAVLGAGWHCGSWVVDGVSGGV